MRRQFLSASVKLGFVILLLATVLSPTALAGGHKLASALVTGFQQQLLQVMKQTGSLNTKARYERLIPVIENSFHLTLMIGTATGKYWRGGSRDQRRRLLSSFKHMSISILAKLFNSYDGERFETFRERRTSQRTVMVDTRVVKQDGDTVDISFVVARIGGRRWIIDVIIGGGISEVVVRRSEYHRLLARGGIEKLITALNAKAADLLAEKPAGPAGL